MRDPVGWEREKLHGRRPDLDLPGGDVLELHGDAGQLEGRKDRDILLGFLRGFEAKRVGDDAGSVCVRERAIDGRQALELLLPLSCLEVGVWLEAEQGSMLIVQ